MKEIKSLDDVHPDLHDAWHERAGMFQFLWGMSQDRAEDAAWEWYNNERENLSKSIGL